MAHWDQKFQRSIEQRQNFKKKYLKGIQLGATEHLNKAQKSITEYMGDLRRNTKVTTRPLLTDSTKELEFRGSKTA